MSGIEVLGGKYELLRELGSGGMAEVFLACQTGVDDFRKLVVIKRILRHLARDEKFVTMFLDEARTAADLRHPNIVTIFDVAEEQGSYYITMEYLHGMSLNEINKFLGDEPMPYSISLQIVIDIARGLHYAHEKKDLDGQSLGIIHRDVSPHNVMVTFEGYSKLVDFGIARAQTKRSHTAPGVVRGKLAYMSPEQAAGFELDPRSDLFSLGVMLHEVTTGLRLHQPGSPLPCQLAMDNLMPLPSTLIDGYPDELEIIVMRCLTPNRNERWPDCKELADALEEFLAFQGVPHSPARVGDWMHRTFPDEAAAEPSLSGDVADTTGPTLDHDGRDTDTEVTAPAPAADRSPEKKR